MTGLGFTGALTEIEELAARLAATGLSPAACRSRAELFAQLAPVIAVAGEESLPPLAFYVPGRIEVLGKHTDYAGGRSMVAAVERGFCFAAVPREDNQLVIIDAADKDTVVFHIDAEPKPHLSGWANYPLAVVRRLVRNFSGPFYGADIAFISDLPPAAGLSSSTALMIGVFLVLSTVNDLPARNEYWHNIGNNLDLAGYLGAMENGQSFGALDGDEGVGTFGGSEDQVAILCAEPNRISQYAFCPPEFEKSIPMPPEHVFVIGHSGVAAEKTGPAREKYNAAARLVARLMELWREATGRQDAHLAAALGSAPDAAERFIELVERQPDAEALLPRLKHFMLESGEIIPAAGEALAAGDLGDFGRWVARSQLAAERRLGNQTPETVFLVSAARQLGAVAATAFGAGFGGSVWALVETPSAQRFMSAWAERYLAAFPQHAATARFFTTPPGPAAFRVS